MDEVLDYLPLSFLNQFAYCPRRFWLMFVMGEMEENAAVLEGKYQHQHADSQGSEWYRDGRLYRSVYVWSDRLRVAGLADFVESQGERLRPVEHKRGRMGKWISDHVQLCAQALCLEERTGQPVAEGEIFYWANRRRERVIFTEELRLQTQAVADAIFTLLSRGELPSPIDHPAKCRDCSLQRICLPKEVLRLKGLPA